MPELSSPLTHLTAEGPLNSALTPCQLEIEHYFHFHLFFFSPHCSTQDASSSAWLKHHNPFGLRKLWNWQVIKISQFPNIKTDFFVSFPHENRRMNCFEKKNDAMEDNLTDWRASCTLIRSMKNGIHACNKSNKWPLNSKPHLTHLI